MNNEWTILTLENMPAGFFAGGYEVDCGEGTVAVRYPHDPEGFMRYLLSYPGYYRYRKAQPKQPSHEEIQKAIQVVSKAAPCFHENIDMSLGTGEEWGNCEDCGLTMPQSNIEAYRKSANDFEEAIAILSRIPPEA